MRSLLVISLLAIAAPLLTSCGKNQSIGVRARVSKPPRVAVDPFRFQAVGRRIGMEPLHAESKAYQVCFPASGEPRVSEEISRRIANNLREWEDCRSEMDTSRRMSTALPEAPKPEEAESRPADMQSPAARNPEYLNQQMRIRLLESRYAAAGEVERKLLEGKIERVKASFEAVNGSQQKGTGSPAKDESGALAGS